MEQARKNLKVTSIAVLILAGLSLINLVMEIFFGEMNETGASESILLVAKITLVVVSLLLLLPQVYVGMKGLRVVANPDASKAHIIWATILLVLAALGVITPVLSIVKLENLLGNISALISALAEVVIFFIYVKNASVISKEN